MAEKKLFGADHEENSNVMFLAQREGKTRLMSFKCNPWLESDHNEAIFLFSGVLAQKTIDSKDDDNTLIAID